MRFATSSRNRASLAALPLLAAGCGGGGSPPPTLVPLSGDWNGDGVDTIGLYDPSTGAFTLQDPSPNRAGDIAFHCGPGGSSIPITGDWDGDGVDTIGLYVPSTAAFFLRNSNSAGS